jgi:ribosomal protein S27E
MAEKRTSDGIIVTCRKCGNWNIIHGSTLKTKSAVACSVCGTELEWQT